MKLSCLDLVPPKDISILNPKAIIYLRNISKKSETVYAKTEKVKGTTNPKFERGWNSMY